MFEKAKLRIPSQAKAETNVSNDTPPEQDTKNVLGEALMAGGLTALVEGMVRASKEVVENAQQASMKEEEDLMRRGGNPKNQLVKDLGEGRTQGEKAEETKASYVAIGGDDPALQERLKYSSLTQDQMIALLHRKLNKDVA